MPNHVHGILEIEPSVGARHAVPLQMGEIDKFEKFGKPVSGSIPTIIRSFKSAVSRQIHNGGNRDFSWQRSYHDRIVRDMEELNRVRYYIQQNPVVAMTRKTTQPRRNNNSNWPIFSP